MNPYRESGFFRILRDLFKSRRRKEMERDMQVRRAMAHIKRQISALKEDEKEFLANTRDAQRMQANDQFVALRAILRKTIGQRRSLERLLLTMRTQVRVKNQIEAQTNFARAIENLSVDIGKMFAGFDPVKVQQRFNEAASKGAQMEHQMSFMMDVMSQMSFELEGDLGDGLVSDGELDSLIAGAVPAIPADTQKLMVPADQPGAESANIDSDILKTIENIEKELKRESRA